MSYYYRDEMTSEKLFAMTIEGAREEVRDMICEAWEDDDSVYRATADLCEGDDLDYIEEVAYVFDREPACTHKDGVHEWVDDLIGTTFGARNIGGTALQNDEYCIKCGCHRRTIHMDANIAGNRDGVWYDTDTDPTEDIVTRLRDAVAG